MLTAAICAIFTALTGYTLAIWSERIKKHLQAWMVKLFIFAFLCDILGTSLMFSMATKKFDLSWHSFCGYFALGVMGLHLIWALISLSRHGRSEYYFHRFSIFAWLGWLAAFISGLPRM